MNRLSFIFSLLILIGFLSYSYQQGISYSWTEKNGVRIYTYNGRQYRTLEDVMKAIKREHPNVIFDPVSPGGGGSRGGSRKPGGNSGGFDITPYKGKNTFSNKIFDDIWKGYKYDKDSKKNFKDMKDRFLKESNKYRHAHKASPLTYDSKLAAKAQAYANYLARLGELVHDPKNSEDKTGENLYYGSPRISHLGVKKWYDEVDLYNFNKPRFSSATGHFTQLVWRNSKKAGFGVAVGPKGVFVVCKYSPPGNYNNEYKKMVLPRVSKTNPKPKSKPKSKPKPKRRV